jgi:protein gp37
MISPGCTNCYAMRMAARLQSMGHYAYKGVTRKSGGRPVWTGVTHLNEKALTVPLYWKRPKKIFVNSMSDLFQEEISDDFVVRVWRVMEQASWHVFQVLTKRPDIMLQIILKNQLPILPNVWLGTSVESGKYKDRIAILRRVPAQVRFVSFEPLIGAIGKVNLSSIHWAIIGGESGPSARPMKQNWIEEIRSQCKAQKTAFFFKQWGGVNKKIAGRVYRGRTWDEFPKGPTLNSSVG